MTDKETNKSVTNRMPDYLNGHCTEAENILNSEHSGHGQEYRDLLKEYGKTENKESPNKELLFLSRIQPSELFRKSANLNKKSKVPGKIASPSLQQMSQGQRHKRSGKIKEKFGSKQWQVLLVMILAAVLTMAVCIILKNIHDIIGLSMIVYLVLIIVIIIVIIKDIKDTIVVSVMNDYTIFWNDEALETKVRSIAGIKGRKIRYSDVRLIKEMDLEGCQIRNISALKSFTNLKVLNLTGCQVSDINALAKLTKLKVLNLRECQIRDISALSSLTKLTDLDLHKNQIRDISPLSSLTDLIDLDLSDNQISDISRLSGLTKLTYLDLENNQITDFSSIEGLEIKDLYK